MFPKHSLMIKFHYSYYMKISFSNGQVMTVTILLYGKMKIHDGIDYPQKSWKSFSFKFNKFFFKHLISDRKKSVPFYVYFKVEKSL